MMGGTLVVASVVASTLLWGNLTNRFVWMMVAVMLWFGLVGFLDDWLKMRSKSSAGLSSMTKLAGQVLMGLATAWAPKWGDKDMAAAAKQHAKNCFIE
jgi:phospho-N-acetylmuramoyl-pentapeptide-transferase